VDEAGEDLDSAIVKEIEILAVEFPELEITRRQQFLELVAADISPIRPPAV